MAALQSADCSSERFAPPPSDAAPPDPSALPRRAAGPPGLFRTAPPARTPEPHWRGGPKVENRGAQQHPRGTQETAQNRTPWVEGLLRCCRH
eukprot:2403223-Alexandrium_andersonii.AAC.1